MDVRSMRKAIVGVYPRSEVWKTRVGRMSDNQIIAIYYSFKEKGRFNTPRSTTVPKQDEPTTQESKQLSFEDII